MLRSLRAAAALVKLEYRDWKRRWRERGRGMKGVGNEMGG